MTAKTNDDGDRDADTRPPDRVFALLGNETRIGIVRALWEAYDPYADDDAVPFSTLFERVGADDTGNFNYHLGKLTEHFVRRTDDGYELAPPGFEVVRAIVAGTATETPALAAAAVDATCRRCGSPVEITYEDATTWARCTGCEGYWPDRGGEIFGFSLPPQGLRERDPDEILHATIVYSIRRFETMSDGVCPACGDTVDAALAVCDDHAPDGVCDACGSSFLGVLTFVCDSCKFAWRSPSYAAVSNHPALVAFYYDHGVEHVPATWAAISRGLDWEEERLATGPGPLRLTVTHDGDRRRFVLDETGTVVAVDD